MTETPEIMTLKCDECSYTGSNNFAVNNHKLRVHNGRLKPWVCRFSGCAFRCAIKSNLRKHQITHKTAPELRKPFQCPFNTCAFRTARKAGLKGHVTARHTVDRTRDFQCAMCEQKFFTKHSLELHIRCHTREKIFQCSQHDHSKHSSASLYSHVRKTHKEPVILRCSFPGCEYSTKLKGSLRIHAKTHDPHRPRMQCRFPGCPFSTISEGFMKEHIRSRHGEGGTKKVVCPLCNKALVTRQSLMGHINHIHTKEEHYKCDKCQYAGKSEGCLRAHRRRMHEDGYWKDPQNWFYCKSCPQRVRLKSMLRLHEKNVHAKEKEFKCRAPDCKYETNYILSLNKHVLRHEEDPEKRFPFGCTFPGCDFRRRYKEQMAFHELLHGTSSLQLECKLCPGKCYPDALSLFFHDCIAHNRKCHKCSLCNFAASKKSNWRKHMRRIHNVKPGLEGGVRETNEVGKCAVFMSSNKIPVVLLERIDVKVLVDG